MKSYGISDIGLSRRENQDKVYICEDKKYIKYYIVADGMGGVSGGEIASTAAIEAIRTYVEENIEDKEYEKEEIEFFIREAIYKANKVILQKATRQKELQGMGTTIVLAIVYKNRVYIGHVGDSRIYRIRNNIIRQLTKDHSYVQALLDKGTITRKEARNHPQKNILLKVVGCEDKVEPDVIVKGFIKDDILVMCSDGLTNMIPDQEIYDTIVNGKENIESTCHKLVDMANDNGGLDNISVILISKD